MEDQTSVPIGNTQHKNAKNEKYIYFVNNAISNMITDATKSLVLILFLSLIADYLLNK